MYPAMITALKPQPDAEPEHPVVAWIAVIAILGAILFIGWARIAVHGTGDLEAALSVDLGSQPDQGAPASAQRGKSEHDAQVDDAVAASRWASAFSP